MKLQNNYYFVKQICAFFLLLIAFFICLYFFNRNSNIISQNNLVTSIIIEKSCSGSKASSITVIYNQSTYNIKLGRMDCAEHNIGKKLKLYYDKKNDILIKSGSADHNLFQLTLASIALLFFLIPWKKILS